MTGTDRREKYITGYRNWSVWGGHRGLAGVRARLRRLICVSEFFLISRYASIRVRLVPVLNIFSFSNICSIITCRKTCELFLPSISPPFGHFLLSCYLSFSLSLSTANRPEKADSPGAHTLAQLRGQISNGNRTTQRAIKLVHAQQVESGTRAQWKKRRGRLSEWVC